MSKSSIPVNQDVNGPLVQTIKNTSNEHIQTVAMTDGDLTDPAIIVPAKETTLQSVNSSLANAATETTLSEINNSLKIMTQVGHDQISIGDSAVALTSGLSNIRAIEIQNISDIDGSNVVFYIGSSTVTATNGIPLRPGESKAVDSSIAWYGICESGNTSKAAVMELK